LVESRDIVINKEKKNKKTKQNWENGDKDNKTEMRECEIRISDSNI